MGGEEIALGAVQAVRVLLWSGRAHSALAVNQDDLHAGTSKARDLRFPRAEIERLPLRFHAVLQKLHRAGERIERAANLLLETRGQASSLGACLLQRGLTLLENRHRDKHADGSHNCSAKDSDPAFQQPGRFAPEVLV